jgi:hypothetical protein
MMGDKVASDMLGKFRWYGVAYLPCDFDLVTSKNHVLGKGLEYGPLA